MNKKLLAVMGLAVLLGGCAHQHHRHIEDGHYRNLSVNKDPNNTQARHSGMHAHVGFTPTEDHGSHGFHGHGALTDNQLQPEDPSIPRANNMPGWRAPINSFRPKFTHKLVGEYAEQMTMELVGNMRYVSPNTPIAVVSLVDLNETLGQTNLLGNQLAESFMTELQKLGLPVLDFKTTGVIQVGRNGDYVFSRNLAELNPNIGIKYVLSGTMSYVDTGAVLNIRMIDLQSKLVVASTKGFIPQFVVESLYPSAYRQEAMMDGAN